MVERQKLVEFLDEALVIGGIGDTSMNGLQVTGATEITRVALATDAAMATYRKAVEAECQMIFVHHGLIWGGLKYITGRNHEHISFLIGNDLNLYAAHLPLDAHPEYGNNAVLARQVGLADMSPFGEYKGNLLGFKGTLGTPMSLTDLAELLQQNNGGEPKILPFGTDSITTLGIVSGDPGSCLAEAIDAGLDCLVTGEGGHPNYHEALEGGINVLYLGHYASETTGIKAVGALLEKELGLETVFIDCPTGF